MKKIIILTMLLITGLFAQNTDKTTELDKPEVWFWQQIFEDNNDLIRMGLESSSGLDSLISKLSALLSELQKKTEPADTQKAEIINATIAADSVTARAFADFTNYSQALTTTPVQLAGHVCGQIWFFNRGDQIFEFSDASGGVYLPLNPGQLMIVNISNSNNYYWKTTSGTGTLYYKVLEN